MSVNLVSFVNDDIPLPNLLGKNFGKEFAKPCLPDQIRFFYGSN